MQEKFLDRRLTRRAWLQATGVGAFATMLAACAPVAAPQAEPAAPAQSAAAASGDLRVSSSGYQGALSYWVLGYAPGNAFASTMDAAVGVFTAANPDITVEITGYAPDQEGMTKLTTAVQGGQAVDIFRLPSDLLPGLVKDDMVVAIDDFLTDADKTDIYPNLLDAVRLKDGKAFAWPLWVPPMGMYMNLDVFEEKGIELPARDWTYEQFLDLAMQLTFTRENGEQVYGFTGFIDAGVVNTWPLFMNEDPSVRPLSADFSKFTFDTPEAAAALTRFAELALVHKVTPPDFGAQAAADVQGGFKNKAYAMYTDASGPSANYAADNVNFDVWPMPTYNGNQVTAAGIGLIAITQSDDTAKLQAAMDLGRYLTSAEVQSDVPGFYLAPGARKSVELTEPVSKFSEFVPYTWITPILAEWPQIRTIIHPELQNIIFGKATAEEAMARIAPEINEILANRA